MQRHKKRLEGWIFYGICATVFVMGFAMCRNANGALAEAIEATCRITAPEADGSRSVGTGCVYHFDGDNYYILTNAHVAGRRGARVDCQFWRDGYPSQGITGVVVADWYVQGQSIDIAIVSIPKGSFPYGGPKVIPFAPTDVAIEEGMPVASVGCARGAWPTAWRGHLRSLDDQRVTFVPPAANGRSGSALFTANGQYVVGLIAWRDDQSGVGVAQPLVTIYSAFQGTPTYSQNPISYRETAEVLPRNSSGKLVPVQFTGPFCPHGIRPAQYCPDCNPGGGSGQPYPYQPYGPGYGQQQPPQQRPPQQQPPPRQNPGDGKYNPWQGGGTPAPDAPDYATKEELDKLRTEVQSNLEALTGQVKAVADTMPSVDGLAKEFADQRAANEERWEAVGMTLADRETALAGQMEQRYTEINAEVTNHIDQSRTTIERIEAAVGEVAGKYKEARQEGAEAGKEAALAVANDKLEALNVKRLVYAMGFSGPLALGLIGLGLLLKRRAVRRVETWRDDDGGAGGSPPPPDFRSPYRIYRREEVA